MQRVINFSGGKTSALMTILEYKKEDLVIFCDTDREHPKTYKFINDFEAFENIPIIRLKYDGGFTGLLLKQKAIPNRFKRFCTIELKVKTARRYLRSIGLMKYENLVGFRYDEQLRIKRRKQHWKQVTDSFPLNDLGITKHHVNEFWKFKPYTLELEPILGNCTLCFQKGENAIIAIMQKYPELSKEWIEDEELIGHTYFKDKSMKDLLNIANYLKNTKQYNLFEIESAFDCACTS
jgi:hypothetical protein